MQLKDKRRVGVDVDTGQENEWVPSDASGSRSPLEGASICAAAHDGILWRGNGLEVLVERCRDAIRASRRDRARWFHVYSDHLLLSPPLRISTTLCGNAPCTRYCNSIYCYLLFRVRSCRMRPADFTFIRITCSAHHHCASVQSCAGTPHA